MLKDNINTLKEKFMTYDCVIIGSGVAGLTAALYLARANKSVLIIEDSIIGGTTATLELIENYPGFVKISGTDLTYNMSQQINELDIPYINEEVIKIDVKENNKTVITLKIRK